MLFTSLEFFIFFAVYYVLHRLTPARSRVFLVIAGSTFFYGWWRPSYVWLPYLLLAIAHLGLKLITQARSIADQRRRRVIVIVLLLTPLLIFKYTNFVYRDVLGPIFGWEGTLLSLALPLGVSFITFTLIAYVVDSVAGRYAGAPKTSSVAAFVLFFPHLIAGPILRPGELIPQFEKAQYRKVRRYAVPIAIFTFGLVKKLVFADQLASSVDAVYATPGDIDAVAALVAFYGFSIQIYCDFSGYTDMAIGLAMLLGVRLPANFLRPYGAESLTDFWRRWHITLSRWLRDYVYIPLGGSRHGAGQTARNAVLTMAIGGLWHGANWTFLLWGLFHGVGIASLNTLRRLRPNVSLPRWAGIFITFHFVALGWILFRAPNLPTAAKILASLVPGIAPLPAVSVEHAYAIVLIALALALHRFDTHAQMRRVALRMRAEVLWPVLALLWIMAIAVSQGSSSEFIYFDF